ncbi:uncharacterized protein O9250_002225 [Rhynochetos jubatus]
MWKAVVGHDVSVKVEAQGDDWDTDPDFVNDVSEREQRWGARTVAGSGRAEHIDIHQLRNKVSEEHEVIKKKELETGPKASYGYGGKFGTERDRMDKCAVGHEYVADVGKHSSQTDAAQGFGGKYGVQRDRADKSALGFEYKGEVEKHSSQKDYSKGFGGRYGVERDKVDKAAVGFDYRSQEEKHNSQKDYSVGFGGKFGVQRDRQDKSALGWDHQEEVQPHASQTDYAKGFGGRFGIQEDRVDESAAGFDGMAAPTSSYERARPLEPGVASGTSSLRSRFEDMAKAAEASRQQAEERARRPARDSHVAQHKHTEQGVPAPSHDPPVLCPGLRLACSAWQMVQSRLPGTAILGMFSGFSSLEVAPILALFQDLVLLVQSLQTGFHQRSTPTPPKATPASPTVPGPTGVERIVIMEQSHEIPEREKDHLKTAPVPAREPGSTDREAPVSQAKVPRRVGESQEGEQAQGLPWGGQAALQEEVGCSHSVGEALEGSRVLGHGCAAPCSLSRALAWSMPAVGELELPEVRMLEPRGITAIQGQVGTDRRAELLPWSAGVDAPCHGTTSSTVMEGASLCQEAKREDEEVPPTLPPRPADLGEELCEDPSQDQPIYSESLDVGGDYEELPEPSHYGNGAVGGADYEELPAPLGKPDATYDHGGDGGEDYEELLPEEPSQSQPHQGDPEHVYEVESPGTCAVALYDYQGDGDDEISFDPEDTITHIEMVDEGWWRGRCRGRVGLFPANYVRLLH